jgi:sRNA-binding protein
MVRSVLNETDKERCRLWRQQMREEKKQRETQRKEQLQLEKDEKKKIKEEEKKQREEQIKNDKKEFIRNFIFDFYEITSNCNDKVQSSILGKKLNEAFDSFIDSKTIKEVLINIQGISLKRYKACNYFCGLKQK